MSYSQPNYMEDVPVKISEKYKPPPKISLPQSIVQRLLPTDVLEQTNYDFNLERNVLGKIAEWKTVRNRDQSERRDRIRQRQLERQQMVDERQKQLLTAVSYPNAEDLSDDETVPTIVPNNLSEPPANELRFSSPNFDTILMPTVMPGCEAAYDKQTTNFSHLSNPFRSSNSSSKINYSDFENDTSSPFDSVELKTINDLDILAQVLNTLQSNETPTPETSTESNTSSDNTPIQQNNILPIDNTNDPIGGLYQRPSNAYGSMISNQTDRLAEFPRYASTYQSNENYYHFDNRNKPMPHLTNAVDVLPTSAIPNTDFYYNYNSPTLATNSYNLSNHNYNVHVGYHMNNIHSSTPTYNYSSSMSSGHLEKSKSKSVPDILKELNDELSDSEMKRQRNNSQSIASPKDAKLPPHNPAAKFDAAFHNLPIASQKLIKNISSMGFDHNRVLRIFDKLGCDDKKIVEHLIPLCELLDLGFEETKISDALIRFDNDKDKALDYLIS
ncbi:Ubiquitin-associated protein 1 [Pseudolycoriella hygida]|uniref:Ubiquitin-associated protein 1 n=1 Tax=Pseudolycoriella hygida TaxID=35572 RepID=A0A9Q0MTN9_9DIPT|nr:Ubiquitin-associated protein 1 [Pseudolycoriella hygida]